MMKIPIWLMVCMTVLPALVLAAGLQGLSLGMHSMVLTLTRQAILPVLFALILRLTGSLTVLWSAFILAEAAGIPLGLWLWRRAYRNAGS